MVETLDISHLTEIVIAHISADSASLRFTPIRTGRHNTSFWIDCDLGRFVLRIAPPDDLGFLFYERRMIRQEPDLHALILDRTSIPVAKVVGCDFTRARLDRDAQECPSYRSNRWFSDKALSQTAKRPWADKSMHRENPRRRRIAGEGFVFSNGISLP